MKIISFAWTTPALISGHKTVTRRAWSDDYAAQFKKGHLVQAYDRSPRSGGKQIATIRLTADPVKESTADAPLQDFLAEGFAHLQRLGVKVNGLTPGQVWQDWYEHPQDLWVIRFEVVEESA